jgi:hypothetical protein
MMAILAILAIFVLFNPSFPSPFFFVVADVHVWMKSEGLEHHFELFKKHEITGKALQELKRLHSVHHPNIFPTFYEKLGIDKFGKILELSGAIQKLQ